MTRVIANKALYILLFFFGHSIKHWNIDNLSDFFPQWLNVRGWEWFLKSEKKKNESHFSLELK